MGQWLLLTNDVDDEDPRPCRRSPLLSSSSSYTGGGERCTGEAPEEERSREGRGCRGREGEGLPREGRACYSAGGDTVARNYCSKP